MKHFFDIGANVGQTFDYLATLDRDFSDYKFWLFEPSPRHFANLIQKCELVGYNVTVCPFGVGSVTRCQPFYEKDDELGDSFKRWHASDHVPENRDAPYRVLSAIVSISDIINDFTKENDEIILDIDAEGSEYEILESLMNCEIHMLRVREIWVEWHRIRSLNKIITPADFGGWCADRGIVLVHRGLQNVA